MPELFLLGGQDLEMVTIRDLLAAHDVPFHDRHLAWGAKASAYLNEIHAAIEGGQPPVLIELQNDLPPEVASRVDWIDHHGPQAGADGPTSLEQVFQRLALPASAWSRWHALVAANDRGHIRAMQAMGATTEEIQRVRATDRAAQGVTPEDEAAAREAISRRETLAGGRLTVVRLPVARTSPVADLLDRACGGPGVENLLVITPVDLNFFGEGALVAALHTAFSGGWCGGNLPDRGFWGHSNTAQADAVKHFLELQMRRV